MSQSTGIGFLCRVCDAPADGIYYAVYACIPCTEFFHSNQTLSEFQPCRSIRQCPTTGSYRTYCSECRLKKCFDKLMRHPVHLETCPYTINPDTSLSEAFLREMTMDYLLFSLRQAHEQTSHLTTPRSGSESACLGYQQNLSMSCWGLITRDDIFIPAIQGVVDFARRIPCFQNLQVREQNHLLHEGAFGMLLMRLACTYDAQSDTLSFWNGGVIRKDTGIPEGDEFSWNVILDFARKVHSLRLTEDEVNIFCLLLIINRYLPGLTTVVALKTHFRLLDLLKDLVRSSKGDAITTGDFLVLIYQINYLKEIHNRIDKWKGNP